MAEDRAAGPRVVALVHDLFFAVRIRDTLRPFGYRVEVANSEEKLAGALRGDRPALLIVDLAFAAIDPPRRIAALKADEPTRALPVLAFAPHLDHAARKAGQDPGADRLVANSKLAEDLPELVPRYAG